MRLRSGPKESYFWRKHLQPYLAAHGFINIRLAFNGIGETDCLAYKYPYYFGIELKRVRDAGCHSAAIHAQMQAGLSKAQRRRIKSVTASGGIHVVMAQGRGGWLYASVTQNNASTGLQRHDLSLSGATVADALTAFFATYNYREAGK